jgi:RNA polymerase sigma factor (sigma-70 family)
MSTRIDEFLPTRKSLLTRLKDWEDQDGWREFFDTYWKLIYSVGRKAGFTEAEAQDLVQETMLSVAKKMRGFKYEPTIGSFKAWLLLNVRSRIADHLRKRNAVSRPQFADGNKTDLLDAAVNRSAHDLEGIWEEEWQRNLLEVALQNVKRGVSPRQFQIFELYVMQELPLGILTSRLGVNIGQVYLAKHRVSQLLKKEVKRLEAKSNGG